MDDFPIGSTIVIHYGSVNVEYVLTQQEVVTRQPRGGGETSRRFLYYWIPTRRDWAGVNTETMNTLIKINKCSVYPKRGGGDQLKNYNPLPKYAHIGKIMPE